MRASAIWIGLLAGCISFAARADTPLAAATIVVFNKNADDSVRLAKFYAEQRGIAADHLVPLDCSPNDEITREEYDTTIRDPLRELLRERGWWTINAAGEKPRVTASTIRFVALIKGVPLKIRATTAPYDGDKIAAGQIGNRNEASVDSELATLGAFSPQISGAVPNPYFQSYRAITEIDGPALLVISRLDAPTAATVRRMITDSLAAERTGLWGRAFVDGAHNSSGGKEMGDQWLSAITEQLHKAGVPVVYDDEPALFPSGYPISNCSLYYGWYAAGISGALADPWMRFVPGAIAVHIHSFSASTLREQNSNWAAPLLTRGAAATLGNVYEPFLQLTTHLDVFNDRLLHGFTFAESASMATPTLSWMNVAVGDPLYRPFAAWLQLDSKRDRKTPADFRAYHEFAAKNADRSAANTFALRSRNAPMLEDLGLAEAHDGNFAGATTLFGQARAIYSTREDILRVALEESDAWLRQQNPKRALDLVRSVSRIAGDAPAAPLLKHVEQEALGALSTAPKRR